MNTNAKHTPGPWKVNHGPSGIIRISAKDDHPSHPEFALAELTDTGKTAEASARLTAAAPAMLDALRYAAELIPTARRYFPKSVKFSDRFQLENVCATIGKAIAQAEGGAQ